MSQSLFYLYIIFETIGRRKIHSVQSEGKSNVLIEVQDQYP